jgi:hypothetical protein
MKRFEGQGKHLLALLVLMLPLMWFACQPGSLEGYWLDQSTSRWYWIAVAIPPVHQFGTMLLWRFELYGKKLSGALGDQAFKLFLAFFVPGLAGRPLSMIALAVADRNTVSAPAWVLDVIALIMLPIVIYLLYSVLRYFGLKRAAGADHFYEEYRSLPMVDKGIYWFMPNAMYMVGFFLVWMPGLIWASRAALLVAAFQHTLIWAHYHFTEKPDMQHIYGEHV